MRRHYSQVIWGIVFVFANFNIGPIDILPNFLGYILIACGLSGLSEVNTMYKSGILASAVLSVFSFTLIFYPISTSVENITPSNLWVLGIPAVFTILNLFIFYSICKGIYNESEKIGNDGLKKSAEMRYKVMFYFTCINLFLTPFTLTKGQSVMFINLIISIILIFLAFLIVLLLRKARADLIKEIS